LTIIWHTIPRSGRQFAQSGIWHTIPRSGRQFAQSGQLSSSPRINDLLLSALTIGVVDSNFFFLAGFGQTFWCDFFYPSQLNSQTRMSDGGFFLQSGSLQLRDKIPQFQS
jgi:hypothetical protein